MILEVFDKATDVCRDYLFAPTATTAAPAMDGLPKPWPEFVAALVFIIIVLALKGFHRHYQLHKQVQAASSTSDDRP